MDNRDKLREEIQDIAPVLANIKNKASYTPEPKYFEQMQDKVITQLGIDLTPVIIPEASYFNELQSQVTNTTANKSKVRMLNTPIFRKLSMIAAVFLLFASAFWLWQYDNTKSSTYSFDQYADDELLALIDDLNEEELFDLLSQDEMYDLKYMYWSDFVEEDKDLGIVPKIFFYD